jgi:hypothetical protein
MPRFYFDLDDTGTRQQGCDAVDLPDTRRARQEALRALGEIVRDEMPDGDYRDFTINVRDESRALVLTATLSLRVQQA